MSGAKHTPGPWLTKPPRIGASITIYGGPDEVFPVATTCSNTSPVTMQAHRDGTVAANALLIAAAPELLMNLQMCAAALRHALAVMPHDDRLYRKTEVTEKAARDLIAKATGAAS